MKTFNEWLVEMEEPQLPQNNDKKNYLEPTLSQKDKNNLKTFIDEDGQWSVNFVPLSGYPDRGVASIYLTKNGANEIFPAGNSNAANYLSQILFQLFKNKPKLSYVLVQRGTQLDGLENAMQKAGFSFGGTGFYFDGFGVPDKDDEFIHIKKIFNNYGFTSTLNSLFKFRNRGNLPKIITRKVWNYLQRTKKLFMPNNELAAKLDIPLEGIHEINYINDQFRGPDGKGQEWAIKQLDKILHKYNSKVLTSPEYASFFDAYW